MVYHLTKTGNTVTGTTG
ncbi:hypothetical protein ACFY1U_10510 [Streptomyces sp. NPDC001351]